MGGGVSDPFGSPDFFVMTFVCLMYFSNYLVRPPVLGSLHGMLTRFPRLKDRANLSKFVFPPFTRLRLIFDICEAPHSAPTDLREPVLGTTRAPPDDDSLSQCLR